MTMTSQEMLAEARRLTAEAEAAGIQLRALGGLAVRMRREVAHPLFDRNFADFDFVVSKKQRRAFESFMQAQGYLPDKPFNLLNGAERQLYYEGKSQVKADIFIGDFVMCHKIPLEARLSADPLTIPLAELLLTKAQILELNRKDALDLCALLLFHETGETDADINLQVIAQRCGADWGLYKTVSINLERARQFAQNESALTPQERDVILGRAGEILRVFESMPKSPAWQIRDRVGARVKWYIEVEEVDRDSRLAD